MGLGIGSREEVILGANVGRRIVTNGEFAAELRFGVVRGVGRGTGVLDWGLRRFPLNSPHSCVGYLVPRVP